MKRIALSLYFISIITTSCGVKKNENQNINSKPPKTVAKTKSKPKEQIANSDPKTNMNPSVVLKPIVPIVESKPIFATSPVIEKVSTIKLGESGEITLNNETGEYNITSKIYGSFDYEKYISKGGFYDSIDINSRSYKSIHFPDDKYVYFKIPKIIQFDKENSVDGIASNNEYDVSLNFWGGLGTLDKSYYACYKSKNNEFAELSFVINHSDNLELLSCNKLVEKIENGEIKRLNINGDDFILLKFSGFRTYSYGNCLNYKTCNIFYKFNISYFTEK